jgi:hypothetical protein
VNLSRPPSWTELVGSLVVGAPVETAFALFSPVGEKSWVPGWDPELLFPSDSSWERGQIFRTRDGRREAVWIVTALDRAAHHVEYHRVETDRHVARVTVRCAPRSERDTDVSVTYLFVGLTEAGCDDIASMTAEAHAERMARWQRWIADHLTRPASNVPP